MNFFGRPSSLALLGVALLIAGVGYDVIFAGIPYQDPTPEMTYAYDQQAKIAGTLRAAGLIVLIASAVWFLISKLRK